MLHSVVEKAGVLALMASTEVSVGNGLKNKKKHAIAVFFVLDEKGVQTFPWPLLKSPYSER